MNNSTIQRITATALVLTALFSCSFGVSQKVSDISDGVVRMHVIANSDSAEDQACKLAVRDALLAYGSEDLAQSVSKAEAIKIMEQDSDTLRQIAENTIRSFGYDYDARIEICRMEFPQKTYGDFVMPAGEYDAVRVILGKGEGQNWWCVMYPPLCIPVAEKFDGELSLDEEVRDVLYRSDDYRIQFAVLEFFKGIGSFFCGLFG